ncbi:thiamine repressible genes regulatory protein thi1 [Plectosphaerella plurivora]|uniref:Thiamine repressible genes regulatory protein thi1 n=1 Tax=Plectosphaerella plurivora TaxID=936078 RepID=A0A9P9AEX3_9PEZI|nr:thiamine repressible genes regulatory protein thi1 [Plectosphaerella plurivora]
MNTQTPSRRVRRRRVADQDRKRAPRACDRCKGRKQSCLETPSGVCQRCLRGSFACRFDRERTPPGTEDGGGHDETSIDNATTLLEDASSIVAPSLETQQDAPIAPQPRPRADLASDDLLGVSPEGATSEMFMWPRFLTKLRDAFCLDPQPAAEERDMAHLQGRISRPPSTPPEQIRRLERVIDRFPPRAVAVFLLSVCICHGTDNFYYFDQAGFASELDTFYSDPDSPLRRDAGFVCLALATFALGSQWTTLARPEHIREAPSPSEGSDPGRIFYDLARTLMGDIVDRACVRSVQAAYVLGVYLMPASAIGASYVYMGLALRKALAIGLHQDSDDTLLGEDERETRRRVFWAVWSLERTVTIKLNKPRSVSQDIITVRLPSILPTDASQKFNNIQHQIANVQLTRVMDTLAQPAAWSSDTQLPPDNYQSLLKSWKRSLPLELKLETTDPTSSGYRAVFHLYLNYYFAWIALGKVSVVTIVRSRLRLAQTHPSEQPAVDHRIESLALSCTKAAKKMLGLFEHLVRTGNLTRFSFTDFQGCSIATIVVLLAGILERESEYHRRVEFGIDCLRKMAGENLTARTGVRFVEALKSIADEARAKLEGSQQNNTIVPQSGTSEYQPADYTTWVHWLARMEQQSGAQGISSFAENPPPPIHEPIVGQSLGPGMASAATTQAWEEEAALQLQGLSASAFGIPMDESGMADPTAGPVMDSYLPSSVFNDDQLYLMGLTGMDVLDFTAGLG